MHSLKSVVRMKELRRKVLIPAFQLSELADESDTDALERVIKQGKGHPALSYKYRLGRSGELGCRYNLFPIVLDRTSAPWTLGTLFILSKLQDETLPVMATSHSRADDIGAFKEWLDCHDSPENLLFNFPKPKLRRTTYRYQGFLKQQIKAGELKAATAKRRMGTVISFYKWLISNNYFTPEHAAWEERDYQFSTKTTDGRIFSISVSSTDLSINAPKTESDFDGVIEDGGNLRPLSRKEQDWILEAAEVKGNSEILLLQLFMLSTGARIESACTLRARHFLDPNPAFSKSLTGDGQVYRLKSGPGTGIETKKNKIGTFQVPRNLYELLSTYAHSARAKVRKARYAAKHGAHHDIYLFITTQGSPYYSAKEDLQKFNPDLGRRYSKNGQGLRQFIKDHAIPYVRARYDERFFYRPHDLRASYGMNMTDEMMKLVQEGKITLNKARLNVKDLMWHSSMAITDRYLNYKNDLDVAYQAINLYGNRLRHWTDRAMKGLSIDD